MNRYQILLDEDCLCYLNPVGEGEIIAPGEAMPFPDIYLATEVDAALSTIRGHEREAVKAGLERRAMSRALLEISRLLDQLGFRSVP